MDQGPTNSQSKNEYRVELDTDIVSFFDLLARFDFEDQKRKKTIAPSSETAVLRELQDKPSLLKR